MTTSVIYYPGYAQEQVQQNLLVRTIASITNSNPMVVTTTVDHGYSPGLNVSFLVPVQYGFYQLNTLNGNIMAVTSDTVTINIDSSNYSPFSYPSPLPSAYTPASIVPNASGYLVPPQPLPTANQSSFEGVIFNNGAIGDPIV